MSSYTERIMAEGSWDLSLTGIPDYLLEIIIGSPFGEVYLTPHRLPQSFHTKAALRGASAFTGVLIRANRDEKTGEISLSGPSNTFWLGDSAKKGPIYKTMNSFFEIDVATVVTALLPTTVQAGSIQTPAGAALYIGDHYLQTPREAETIVGEESGGEWRVNPDNTFDFGSITQLGYVSTPQALLIKRPMSIGESLAAIRPSSLRTLLDVEDYVNEPLITGQGGSDTIILGEYVAATPYFDPEGNALDWRGLFNEPILYVDEADARAETLAGKTATLRQQLNVGLNQHILNGPWKLGDQIYAYAPPFLQDMATVIVYGGSVVNPVSIRIIGVSRPITRDMGVYFRDHSDVIYDLTDYFVASDAEPTLEIGELSRSAFDVGLRSTIAQGRPFVVTDLDEIAPVIGGRDIVDIVAAINADANLVTDVVNARLNSQAQTILAGFTFGAADYAGALKSGDITWNPTTGAVTGGSGVIVYRAGIIGAAAGVTTFALNAATGAATFAGTLSAPSGTIGGFTIGATALTAGAGASAVGIAPASYPFYAGSVTAASAPFRVTAAGALVATNATITGAITATSGSFTGAVYASSGSFTGDVTATSGSFTGAIYASSGSFTGSVYASSGTIAGFTISASALTATSNQQVLTAPSSDSAPGLAHSTNTTTGIRFTSGPSIRFILDGSAVMILQGTQLLINGFVVFHSNNHNASDHNGMDHSGHTLANISGHNTSAHNSFNHTGHDLGSTAFAANRVNSGTSTWKNSTSSYEIKTGIRALLVGDILPTVIPASRLKNRGRASGSWRNPVLDLIPVEFHSIPDEAQGRTLPYIGLVAQQVEEVFPEAFVPDLYENKQRIGLAHWDTDMVVTALLAKVKEQETRLAFLEAA